MLTLIFFSHNVPPIYITHPREKAKIITQARIRVSLSSRMNFSIKIVTITASPMITSLFCTGLTEEISVKVILGSMIGLANDCAPINRSSRLLGGIVPFSRESQRNGLVMGHKIALSVIADLDGTASLVSRGVLQQRSDDLRAVLADENLAGSFDRFGEKIAKAVHEEIVNVELVDIGVLLNGCYEKSAHKALEVGAEFSKLVGLQKSISPLRTEYTNIVKR